MGLFTNTTGKKRSSGLGFSSPEEDLGTSAGLASLARRKGLGAEGDAIVEPEQKLSVLQRLGKGLGAFNPAEAILTGMEKGVGAGLLEYPKGIVQGVGAAVTGTDYEPERRGFKEIAEKAGIENKILKGGIGFVGDVLLDPTTYFGGALAKGIGFVGKGAGGLALKGVGKVAPEVEAGLRIAGEGAKDALGSLFKFGYKASRGATDDLLTHLSKTQRAQMELAASNLDRLGANVLDKTQQQQLALALADARRVEFAARESSRKIALSSDEFLPISDKLDRMMLARESKLNKLQSAIQGLDSKRYAKSLRLVRQEPKNLKSAIEYKSKSPTTIFRPDDTVARYVPRSTTMRDVFATTSNRGSGSTKSFIEALVRDPTQDIAALKRKLTTKEGNLNDVLDEVGRLKTEYEEIQSLKFRRLQTADQAYASGTSAAVNSLGNISDPLVRKTAQEQIARTKDFAKMAGVENPYEVYYPFIRKDKLAKFLGEIDAQGVRVGSEGYRKQFKNLLTNDNLELNPAKAYFTRESQIVTDKMHREFLQEFVGKYGKNLDEFKGADDAFANGYEVIKEKGRFGKEVGYIKKWDAKLLKDMLSPEYQAISMVAKATGFDAITSLFKRSVTGLFAPFHVRNFASGIIQNFEVLGKDALDPRTIASGMKLAKLMGQNGKIPDGVMTIAGKPMKLKEVLQPLFDRFAGDSFYSADFDLALKHGDQLKQVGGVFTKGRFKETLKTAGLGQEAIPFKVGRAVGQFIEHQQKATAYLAALGQGKSIPEALSLAEKAGFDYRALTRFESQIMRRIIPFYSFTRKNIGLQLDTLSKNPQRINQVFKVFSNAGETPSAEEKKSLPDYIKDSLGIKWSDTPEGIKQYISNFGTPIEGFAQLFGSNPILRGISMMNPILKAPVELGIGKDSFRRKDIKEVYDAREYKMAPQFIKDFLQLREVQQDVLKQGPLGKLVKTGSRTQYVADPERLLVLRSLFTARGFSYLDQVFGGDLQGMTKVLKTTTGIKPNQINESYQTSLIEKEKRRELEDLLLRNNVIEQFSRNYIPKGRI